jgi:phenylpropionate dioxygenase-like ring-hydroxylating dioxygenase large terminal subunit
MKEHGNEMSTDTEVLTRVGPGTPMGELMRQYWFPAAMSSEVKKDSAPLRLKLLGEKLIAFRDSTGRVGILDHRCPHRCASLFYARNEEEGIRCVYHGWKFDVDGNCVEAPNLPKDQTVRDRVKATAYATQEKAGLIWIYMGKREVPPPMPDLPALSLPEDKLSIWCVQRQCNYLQAMEGDIDTSHLGFLHGGLAAAEDPALVNRSPEYKVADTECGVIYGAHRAQGEHHMNWRFANFSLPFWTQPPPTKLGRDPVARAFVPMDDERTMFFSISNKSFVLSNHPNEDKRNLLGGAVGVTFDYQYQPITTDWYGRWRLKSNESNDYLIDREVQRTGSFTGIEGLEIQDVAITESIGPITDHSLEHLAPSDIMVVRTRRRLLRAAIALRDQGTVPPGVDQPAAYGQAWGGFTIAPKDVDWLDVYRLNTAGSSASEEAAG